MKANIRDHEIHDFILTPHTLLKVQFGLVRLSKHISIGFGSDRLSFTLYADAQWPCVYVCVCRGSPNVLVSTKVQM